MNVNLNAGGLLGALLGAAIVTAIFYSMGEFYERGHLAVGGVIVGALVGNPLWEAAFKNAPAASKPAAEQRTGKSKLS